VRWKSFKVLILKDIIFQTRLFRSHFDRVRVRRQSIRSGFDGAAVYSVNETLRPFIARC
jgi:hypothetical protein